MKAVAYCRVSTNKEEQLDSLESQQTFFSEYAKRNGLELIRIYADEGKSGTKMKNRTELLRLLADAGKDLFEIVLIKDVSRLARNTLDFLTSIRNLKSLGIKVVFVNYDQTSSGSSEFMLTMLSAIAQEESANTSKRVKFGKKQNAEKGKVPNLIFGYDKIPGDYFHLDINQKEAETVKRIYHLYTKDHIGANRIAYILNQEGIKTKRNCKWTQTAVTRILNNPIYIGRIVNGKQEVEDFLTGKRRTLEKNQWMLAQNPRLKIIEEDVYFTAQKLLQGRHNAFKQTRKRTSEKHVLSQLITCKACGSSFRRLVRQYKSTYITWVCNGRNSNGVDFCNNKIIIDEEELLLAITEYIKCCLQHNTNWYQTFIKEIKNYISQNVCDSDSQQNLLSQIKRLNKEKEKYIDMYTNDIISLEELKEKNNCIHNSIEYYQKKLDGIILNGNCDFESIKNLVFPDSTYNTGENSGNRLEFLNIIKPEMFNNNMIKRVMERIEANPDGRIDIYIKHF
ncbi:recombinase family protein [Anaerocolumna aminovalerica]|uniref:recombinase family protein n=1 Tax=Anaerocolumna aminovalerica TaxID=1527 RepID=UPI001C0F09B9|nr:recombinase family protein [Anaerocolumna aminovalerica]MBU5332477.1 recombinase family protein [Anaerocolumna aminovalerica]